MVDEATGGDDDWVKQMLAEAMLGRSPLPAAADVSDSSGTAESPPSEDPDIRYQVVLDEPVDELPVDEAMPDDGPVEQSLVDDVSHQDALVENAPVEPAAAVSQASIDEEVDAIAPASAPTSRLFDRPNFDATNDPGVEEMLADARSEQRTIEVSDERSRIRGALEWLVVLGSAVVVALLLRAFLFQAFFIPSESMEETLRVDDRVLVNKLSYRFGDVERGEVVVFRRPEDQPGEFRDLIKRVIGLPGESIEARDNTIFIDGQVLIEPYLTPGEVIGDFGPIAIPEGEYFMMGDNRDNSGDSRVFGTIDGERIIGRAFFLFWPLDRIGSL